MPQTLNHYQKNELKPSGIEWLGDIPKHWEVKKLKYLVDVIDEPIEEASFLIAVENIESKTSKIINLDLDKTYQGTINRFMRGDTLFNKLRPYLAKVYYAERDGGCVGELLVLRSKGKLFDKFLYYRTISRDFIKVVDGSTYGTKMPRANWGDFISLLPIPFPPLAEQEAIASYLDGKCGEIDKLIANKQRIIALLQEERTAMINQAVTRGLNPKAKLKPSGIEWLGDVPEHWEMKKLKYLVNVIDDAVEETDFLIAVENIESKTGRIINWDSDKTYQGTINRFHKGDTLFNKLRPYLAKVYCAECEGGCIGELLVLRSKGQLYDKFLFYRVISRDFINTVDGSTYGTKMPRASWGDFISQLLTPIPPLSEQHEIVEYIDQETARIDGILSRTKREIELLQEYRTALISEVVTGKVRVSQEVNEGKPVQKPKAKAAFRRSTLIARIISEFQSNPHFGRTKLMKIFYITEHHLQFEDLETSWGRFQAGPYDNQIMKAEAILKNNQWFGSTKKGNNVHYYPLKNPNGYNKYYPNYFGDRISEINHILELFRPLELNHCEAIATLYGAWNDLILQGESVTDERIIDEFYNNWHEKKKKFKEEDLRKSLTWMRKKAIVPTGWFVSL